MDKVSEELHKLLELLSKKAEQLDSAHLALFRARKGNLSSGQLMVVGRALNGGGACFTPEELSDTKLREQIVRAAERESCGKSPMSWVTDLWSSRSERRGKARYNTAGSPFWRVIKHVTLGLGIAEDNREWPEHLLWSNLYKVAPVRSGNPARRVIDSQHQGCLGVFQAEVNLWMPRRILLITGLDWAGSFLKRLGYNPSFGARDGVVCWAGSGRIGEDHSCQIVVTERPEGNKRMGSEKLFAEEVVKTFGELAV